MRVGGVGRGLKEVESKVEMEVEEERRERRKRRKRVVAVDVLKRWVRGWSKW